MKSNFKRTLSLILAVLMVMTAVPMSGMATGNEPCDHANGSVFKVGKDENGKYKHYVTTCPDCNVRGVEECDGPAATTCGEAPKCTICAQVIGEALPHSFTKEEIRTDNVASEGNCKTKKTYYKICTTCGALPENLEGAATFEGEYGDHVFTTYEAKGDATCTDPGHKVAICDVNGCEEKNEIDGDNSCLKPHDFKNIVDSRYQITAPSCKNKGEYYKKCSKCGAKGTETFETEKLDHTFVEDAKIVMAKEPTCSECAYYFKRCSGCNAFANELGFYDEIFQATKDPAHPEYGPHAKPTEGYKADKKGGVVKASEVGLKNEDFCIQAATCNDKAQYSYLCARCYEPMLLPNQRGGKLGLDYYEDGEPINPNHQNVLASDGKTVVLKLLSPAKTPTCTEEGVDAAYECLVVGCPSYGKKVRGEKIDKLGHKFDPDKKVAYKDVVDTCKADGNYAREYCTVCKHSYFFDANNKEVGSALGEQMKTIEKADHTFVESLDYCTVCGAEKKASNCSCIVCNGQGIMYFIGLILKFFWKLTGSNQFCKECGAQHY